jgi:lipopolysaccharide heptosyltransferase I
VLVVRLGALGDIVHTVPAVSAIASALPGASIDWLVERRHRPVLDLFATGASPIEIEPSASWLGTRRVVTRLRAASYDVALDFQGLLKSAVLARLSGARRVVGFVRSAVREPLAGLLYSERVDPGGSTHIIAKNLALARAIGASAHGVRFPLTEATDPITDRSHHVAILNPGAGWPNKQWAPERFGRLAAALRDRRGLGSIVTWGPGEERLAHAVVEASGGSAEAAPATSLPSLMTLLRRAALIVSGDTGPIHLAAAAGTPVVGIYGPTDPRRNGPWSPLDQTASRFETCVCHHKRRCHRASRCLDEIEVEEVLRAALLRLDQPDVASHRS